MTFLWLCCMLRKRKITNPFGQRCVWVWHFGKLWDILGHFGRLCDELGAFRLFSLSFPTIFTLNRDFLQKRYGPTNRPTNQRRDTPFYRDAWTHLKTEPDGEGVWDGAAAKIPWNVLSPPANISRFHFRHFTSGFFPPVRHDSIRRCVRPFVGRLVGRSVTLWSTGRDKTAIG